MHWSIEYNTVEFNWKANVQHLKYEVCNQPTDPPKLIKFVMLGQFFVGLRQTSKGSPISAGILS